MQDCELCNRLAAKLEVLANNAGMANVCLVPLPFIFMRGQGVKIFSLVAKRCRDDGFLIPTRARYDESAENEDDQGYEGAIVLEPQTGMYLEEPVSVLDYNSLYPSSMISHNLSHDTLVIDDAKYGRVPGVRYVDVTYDRFEGKGDERRRVPAEVEGGEEGRPAEAAAGAVPCAGDAERLEGAGDDEEVGAAREAVVACPDGELDGREGEEVGEEPCAEIVCRSAIQPHHDALLVPGALGVALAEAGKEVEHEEKVARGGEDDEHAWGGVAPIWRIVREAEQVGFCNYSVERGDCVCIFEPN